MLDGAHPLHTCPDFGGGNSVILASQLLVRHGRDLDVQIDTVEQRTADLAEVTLDDAAGATALPRGIAEKSAGAPVQVRTDVDPNVECRAAGKPSENFRHSCVLSDSASNDAGPAVAEWVGR